MPRWYVEIFVGQDIKHIGEPFVRKESQEVLTFLTTCLTEPSFTIIKDDNYHFWISSDFDTLNNEEEVYQYAQNQLPILNGIMQIKFATNICTIQVGDIYHPDNDGLLTRNTIRVTARGGQLYPFESFLQNLEVKKPATLDLLLIARNNPLVAEALQHFATSHNWYNLAKVFEIIRDDSRFGQMVTRF